MVDVYIRPVTETDLTAIAFIERLCFDEPWSPLAFRQFIEARGFLVAIQPDDHVDTESPGPPDGTLRGYVVTTPAWGRHDALAHLRNLAVDPAKRERGIGSELLTTSLEVYRSSGYKRVKLEVRASNDPAISLYRKHGFEVIARTPGYYDDGEAALIMMNALS